MAELPGSLVGLQRALRAGEITAALALRLQDERLRRGHAAYRCVSWLPEALPERSAASGPLAGIGLAHKDIFATRDRTPGLGCGPGSPRPGLLPAQAIGRLEAAGAVQLGALAMAEYACGATGANEWLGDCVNPLNERAVVGGSSSGSAAAVAAALVYGSLGTDTAGSVRIPAATCGLIGLKTTSGMIPTDGVQPLAPSLDTVGVLAGASADAAQLLAALDGACCARGPSQAPRLRAWLGDPVLHEEPARIVEAVAREQGARLRDFPVAEFERLSAAAEIVLRAETAATHRDRLLTRSAPRRLADIGLAGLAMPACWREQALSARPKLLRDFVAEHLAEAEILLLPALARPVPDWHRVTPGHPDFHAPELLGLHRYMGFVNYLGLPAAVVPVATDSRGMPIAVQLIARPRHEGLLLAFAERIETNFVCAPRRAVTYH